MNNPPPPPSTQFSHLPVGERLQALAKVYLHIEKQIQILGQIDISARYTHPTASSGSHKTRMEQILQVAEQFQSLQERSQSPRNRQSSPP